MRKAVIVVFLLAAVSAVAFAFEAEMVDLKTAGPVIKGTLQISDAIPARFRRMLEEGATLHLAIQVQLWEDRAWDRQIGPDIVTASRIERDAASGQVTISDRLAGSVYPSFPEPLVITVDVGRSDRVQAEARYYVNVVATLGTLDAGELRAMEDAVFGGDSEGASLASLAKFIFRHMMQVRDYLQRVTTEVTSRKFTGAEIRAPR